MKKSVMLSMMLILFLAIAGCGYLIPEDPETVVGSAEGDDTAAPDRAESPGSQVEAAPDPEAAVDDIIEQVVEEESAPEIIEQNLTNETNISAELVVSGSLDLQTDLDLCPHLASNFSCDKYDVRRCEFAQTVGKNDYYPDLINCRDANPDKGENPQNKYCIIQECQPLHEEGIVYAYGGPTIFAEYGYRVEKVGGGIMTHYDLRRCGEMQKDFESEFDCTVYKAELDKLWVNT